MPGSTNELTRDRFDAVLFDLDGVLTDTARLHASAWKQMFDEYLAARAERTGEPFRPFDIGSDYVQYVDGKPRFDGVRDFLASRDIELPQGAADDPPARETVCGLGNRKNELVNATMAAEGVEAYPGSVALVRELRAQGMKTAVVTSSSNCETVLAAAKIADLFDARVDGNDLCELGLAGKPAPDAFLEAARRLGVDAKRAVVVEDAISGVQAGSAGGFGLVLGVARKDNAQALADNGADLVVNDLAEVLT
jgi:alpha,alpha-trehalase